MTPSNFKIAVIGAGPCGLSACKTLKEFGLEFECLEASEQVGGVWNIENGGSGYRSLHTNTSTDNMVLSGFPFDAEIPTHPSASQMVDYFSAYAQHFNLLENVSFGVRVEKIEPDLDQGWRVALSNGDIRHYSNVIVATGRYSKPHLPDTPLRDDFSGQVIHANDYLDLQSPVDLRDKRVVVVGLGSSAVEIASDLALGSKTTGCAAAVTLSTRSGRWVIPKMLNGKPADAAAPHPASTLPLLLRLLPNRVGIWLTRRVMGKAFRKQFAKQQAALDTKLPEPKIAPWADRPTLSSDFIPCLKSGKIDLRPGIQSFSGETVLFSDGSSCKADVVIYATGYRAYLPFIDESILGTTAQELSLYQRIAHPEHPGLFFVGYCPVMCPLWPVAEQQSRWVARLLSGSFRLPSKAKQRSKAVHLSNSLPIICHFYVDNLRRQAGGLSSHP